MFLEKNGVLGIGYGVSERFRQLNGGLTLLMDYKFLEYAQKLAYKEVSFGMDGNLYGFDLNPGLIQYKIKIGFFPIPSKKTFWVNTFITKLKKIKGVKIYNEKGEGIISFNLDNLHAHDVASLMDDYGICIRAGHHCAMPLMNKLGLTGTCRISFSFYNTFEEIDVFINALKEIIGVIQ